MTKAKSPQTNTAIKLWLDLNVCENIYNSFREEYKKSGDEPLPKFNSRYPGRLESIIESVRLRYGQLESDTQISTIASDYFVRITKSQSLLNGNKRMGVLFTSVFLYLNDYDFRFGQTRLAELSLSVASSQKKLPELQKEIQKIFRIKIKKREAGFRVSFNKFVQFYVERISKIKLPNPLPLAKH